MNHLDAGYSAAAAGKMISSRCQFEVLLPTGKFVKIADLPADSTSFVDTMSLQQETEYTYRIRPYRGADLAQYRAPASATTLGYAAGSGTCPP